jgi:hypothetical protein
MIGLRERNLLQLFQQKTSIMKIGILPAVMSLAVCALLSNANAFADSKA